MTHSRASRATMSLLWLSSGGLALADEPAALDRVVVVGSRLPRIDVETALPVQIIDRRDIERSGVLSAQELLDRVSASAGAYGEALGIGDQDRPGFAGASLRGFGASQTLVLLNGRRLANYAFSGVGGAGVDLHAIPLAAIERVEILKDGASAIYGSDAIAGTINFVTRSDFRGGEVTLAHERPEASGGQRARATLLLGGGSIAEEGYNLWGVLDLQRSRRLRAADRAFGATAWRPEIGLDGLSLSSFPANIRRVVGGRPAPLNPAAPGCTEDTVFRFGGCAYDYAGVIDLLPPSRQIDFLGRGAWRIDGSSQLHAEVMASNSRLGFLVAPSPANASTTRSGARFVLPATSPYYPTSLGLSGPLTLAYRTTPLGPRTSETESDHVRMLLGWKGLKLGWDFDAAATASESRARQTLESGYVDAGRLSTAIGTGLVNPFGPSGPEGDALLAGTELSGPSRRSVGRTYALDLRGSRDLVELAGGAVSIALGAEARRETLTDEQLPIVEDVVGGLPAARKTGTRNVFAAYAEALVPVTRRLELQAAARIDRYQDFGTAVSPKLALRYAATPGLMLRASAGRGFRAPSLPELYTAQQAAFTELLVFAISDPLRCPFTNAIEDCLPVVRTITGGNPELKAQRSQQASAGWVLESRKGRFASMDVWTIRIKRNIASIDPDSIYRDLQRYEGRNVVRGPVDPARPDLPGPLVSVVALNENLGDWRVSGVDLAFVAKAPEGPLAGSSVRLDGSYVWHARQDILEDRPVNLLGPVVARWKHALVFAWEREGWDASATQRLRRGYVDRRPAADGQPHRVRSLVLWDVQAGVAIARGMRASIGVRNLFDRAPPASNQTTYFQPGYDPSYADPRGRTFAVAVSASW